MVPKAGLYRRGLLKSLMNEQKVRVTHALMTRFWIKIQDAVHFMLENYAAAPKDKALVPPIKAAFLMELIDVMAEKLNIDKFDVEFVGLRPGEKIDEVLHSVHSGEHLSSAFEVLHMSRDELSQMLTPSLKQIFPFLNAKALAGKKTSTAPKQTTVNQMRAN